MVLLFDPQSPAERRRAAIWSLMVACIVFTVKFAGFVVTRSTAILSDAMESLVNIAAAALLIYGIRVSDKPPDEEHPFGHGKVDFLVSSFEGGAIIVASFLIVFEAASNWISGSGPHNLISGLVIVAVASLMNAVLGYYLLRVGRRTSSLPLVADAKHVLSDVWTSVGVFVGLYLAYLTGKLWIDSAVAIVVALFILRTGWKLFHQAILGIMDTAEPEVVAQIENILKHPQDSRICSYHKLRHRLSGGLHYVDFHIQVPRTLDVETAHQIATAVEMQIAQVLGHAGVLAHIEPCIAPTCKKCHPQGGFMTITRALPVVLAVALSLSLISCGSSYSSSGGGSASSGWTVKNSSGAVVAGTDFIGTDNRIATGGVTKGTTSGDFEINFVPGSTTNGWAAGNLGEIWNTTTGGTYVTAFDFSSLSAGTLKTIFPVSATAIWIGGKDDVSAGLGASIWATSDGMTTAALQMNTAATFTGLGTHETDRINQLYFTDATHGMEHGL